MRKLFAPLLALFCACLPARAQERPVAFRGATIVTVSGAPVPNGVLVVHRGKIVAVGAAARIPEGAEVVDASGKFIMPGLVDTHSHIGGGPGGEGAAPTPPG